jgi:hypothetical protein
VSFVVWQVIPVTAAGEWCKITRKQRHRPQQHPVDRLLML